MCPAAVAAPVSPSHAGRPRGPRPRLNRRVSLAFGLVVLAALPSAAFAQTPRPFVTVASLAGFEFRSRPARGEPWGVTPEIVLGLGTPLSRHVDLRMEVSVASTLRNEYTEVIDALTYHQQLDTHLTIGSALLGYGFTPYGPLTVRLLGGVGVVARRTHYEIDSFVAPAVAPPAELGAAPTIKHQANAGVTYGPALTLGFDAEFAVTRRIRLVPQARTQVFSGAWRFDPGMAVRIAF